VAYAKNVVENTLVSAPFQACSSAVFPLSQVAADGIVVRPLLLWLLSFCLFLFIFVEFDSAVAFAFATIASCLWLV
jgi:hypothetical protein